MHIWLIVSHTCKIFRAFQPRHFEFDSLCEGNDKCYVLHKKNVVIILINDSNKLFLMNFEMWRFLNIS